MHGFRVKNASDANTKGIHIEWHIYTDFSEGHRANDQQVIKSIAPSFVIAGPIANRMALTVDFMECTWFKFQMIADQFKLISIRLLFYDTWAKLFRGNIPLVA